jgi:hypothetical protein
MVRFSPCSLSKERIMDLTKSPPIDAVIENRTFNEIAIGESASVTHTLINQDIELPSSSRRFPNLSKGSRALLGIIRCSA